MRCKTRGCEGDPAGSGAARGLCARCYRQFARTGSVAITIASKGTVAKDVYFGADADTIAGLEEAQKARGLATLSALMREIVAEFLKRERKP